MQCLIQSNTLFRKENSLPAPIREDVIANTGFELLFVDPLPTTPEPTDK